MWTRHSQRNTTPCTKAGCLSPVGAIQLPVASHDSDEMPPRGFHSPPPDGEDGFAVMAKCMEYHDRRGDSRIAIWISQEREYRLAACSDQCCGTQRMVRRTFGEFKA